jgi:hypothetical protein
MQASSTIQGISIKRVTISGVSNVEALHFKKDHFGKEILNKKLSQNVTYKQIKSLQPLEKIIKVRINHIGEIVKVEEY